MDLVKTKTGEQKISINRGMERILALGKQLLTAMS